MFRFYVLVKSFLFILCLFISDSALQSASNQNHSYLDSSELLQTPKSHTSIMEMLTDLGKYTTIPCITYLKWKENSK